MIKALCGTLVNEVLYDCVQFHGGMGYMRETASRTDGDATPASRPSAAAPPRSCWKKSRRRMV